MVYLYICIYINIYIYIYIRGLYWENGKYYNLRTRPCFVRPPRVRGKAHKSQPQTLSWVAVKELKLSYHNGYI